MAKSNNFLALAAGTFVVLLVLLSFVVLADTNNSSQRGSLSTPGCIGLEYGEKCFELEVADTNQTRKLGLSSRDSLAKNNGMLFVFEAPSEQCFWMKDMRFDLDIIWTDESKRINKIEKNVSPSSYPESFCAAETKYVLEFNAGFAELYGLKVGDELNF